jgi:hypothetical protein
MSINKDQAVSADVFHYGECARTVGPRGGVTESVEQWRRNGQTKVWKTRPAEFRVPVKFGMRSYTHIDQGNAHLFHAEADCPLRKLDDAKRLVADDQRKSYPDLTDDEAIRHVCYTVDPDALDDPESELGQAYVLVLRTYA